MNTGEKLRIIFFVLLLCIKFTACTSHEEITMKYVEENANGLKLAVYVGDYDDLTAKVSNHPSAESLNQQIGFKYIKTESFGYRTIVNTDEGYVIIYFDNNQIYVSNKKISFSNQVSIIEMETLKEGMALKEVQLLDPEGDYSFIFHSWSEYPRISYHYLTDGYGYEIHYSDSLEISEIHCFIL